MRVLDWFAANPVAANLLLVLIVAAGLLGLPSIRQEAFPRPSFDVIAVGVSYPGAAPDEVEEAVCVRIEEAIHGVDGVRRILSSAGEGFGSVVAELTVGADTRRALEDIRTRVEALDTLPDEAESPLIQELVDDDVLLSVAIYGHADERTLREVGERIRDEVASLPSVPRAELVGVRPYEIAIEVSEADLRRHALSFDDVARAARTASIDLPGGALKTRSGEVLVRIEGQAQRGVEFERLPLLTRDDGARLTVGQVARVVDGFAELDEQVRFDGRPAVLVRLMQGEVRDQLEVSREVRAWLEESRARIPEGLELAIWNDVSTALESRRDLLLRNAAAGLALVVLVLALLLQGHVAFWVSAGIPVAFVGALLSMALLDVSINMMSLFAFIVALGLVVDDAIVVAENVVRHQEPLGRRDSDGVMGLRAAIAGLREVATPVVAAVITTVLFMLPMLWLPTMIGKVARSLPIVVIACLLFSLVESLLILPAHLATRRPAAARAARPGTVPRLRALQRISAAGFDRLRDEAFAPLLDRALRWPWVTLSLSTVSLLLAVAAVAGGWVRYSFFPEVEADVVTAELVMAPGTPVATTWARLERIEAQARVLERQLDAEAGGSRAPLFEHMLAMVGDPPDDVEPFDAATRGGDGAHVGRVRIQLVPGEGRAVSSLEVEERWRTLVGPIAGSEALRFTGSDISDGPPIEIQLAGVDRATLGRAANALMRRLAAYPGVREISDSMRGGKREVKLSITAEAEARGLTLAELARQVRQGFHGEEVQHVQRGRDDVAVVVRYPAHERRSLADLEGAWIRTPDGGELPFVAVAKTEFGHGFATLQRRDRRRTLNVVADVDPGVADARAILADVRANALPGILAEHPGVEFGLDGLARESAEFFSGVLRFWAVGLIAAYALLATMLGSYAQPLLILLAIPFGFVGAVIGHAALGLEISAFSIIGLIALSGVVVNDALLFADAANRVRACGAPLPEALREGASTRFRPIVLTSLTTFFGLLPLLFERSAQAAWLKPMAVTLGVGVIFATAITLLLVPAAWLVCDGLGARLGRALRLGPTRRETGAPPPTSARLDIATDSRTSRPGCST